MKETRLRPRPTPEEIALAQRHNLVVAQTRLIQQQIQQSKDSHDQSVTTRDKRGSLWVRLYRRFVPRPQQGREQRQQQELEQMVRSDQESIATTVAMFREFAEIEQREVDQHRAIIGNGDVSWARAAFELRNETGMTLHELKELDPADFNELVKDLSIKRSGRANPSTLQDGEEAATRRGPSKSEKDAFYAYCAAYKYLWERTHKAPQPKDVCNVLRTRKDLWPAGSKIPDSNRVFLSLYRGAAERFGLVHPERQVSE